MNKRILIVERDLAVQGAMGARLIELGCQVLTGASGTEALGLFQAEPVDLVLMDAEAAMAGIPELVYQFSAQRPAVPIVVTTTIEDRRILQRLLDKGAWNCIGKHAGPERLRLLLESAFAESASVQEMGGFRTNRRMRPGLADLVGRSPAMTALKHTILELAQQADGRTVAITGESGTGKSLVARALHRESERAEGFLVALDCATLPSAMVESEIFGLQPSEVTGAPLAKPGLLDPSSLGAVLLENVSALPPRLQSRLVDLLASRQGEGAGPLVLLTSRNGGTDRFWSVEGAEDAVPDRLHVPPLRERPEDLGLLLRSFLDAVAPGASKETGNAVDEIAGLLTEHDWPGNVRELRLVVERATAAAGPGNPLTPGHFVVGRGTSAGSLAFAEPVAQLPEAGCTLEGVEQSLLEQALARAYGNQTKAAALLGISRDQLRYKVRKHGLH